MNTAGRLKQKMIKKIENLRDSASLTIKGSLAQGGATSTQEVSVLGI